MGNSISEESVQCQLLVLLADKNKSITFSQQFKGVTSYEKCILKEKQMRQQFENNVMAYFLADIKNTMPNIILNEADEGIHHHVYQFKITDDIYKFYRIYLNRIIKFTKQRKSKKITQIDTYCIILGIYNAIHSDEFRNHMKEWNKELDKKVVIHVPRRFKEPVNGFTGVISIEMRDKNFEADIFIYNQHRFIYQYERYTHVAEYYYNTDLNYMTFSF
jgi:hypothetical protein